MTTTVVKVIGTGGDYSTVQAWEDASPADLTAVDEIWEGQCLNQNFASVSGPVVTFSGTTTDATRFKRLTTQAGASFRDNAGVQTNALRYNAANGASLTCSDTYANTIVVGEGNVVISKLQIESSVSTTFSAVSIGSVSCLIDFCIVESLAKSIGTNVAFEIRNSLVIKRSASASTDIVQVQQGILAYNCTFAVPSDKTAASIGVEVQYPSGTSVMENCAIFGATDAYKNTGTTTITTCRASQTTTIETGFTGSVAYTTSTFTGVLDSARDFRLVSGSSLVNAGTTDSTNSANDIAGTTRPQGSSYDVGCWEFLVAAAALASGAVSTNTVAGAVTTAIKAAGAATSVITSTANLMRLMAAAVSVTSGTGSLGGGVSLAVAAVSSLIGSGTLSGGLALAGLASVNSTAMAALTNWTSVTLQAPLYTGPGGLLDPSSGNWPDVKPSVGSVVFYDGTYLAITPDARLSGTSNNFTAIAQFQDSNGNWTTDTVTFTPNQVAYANSLTSAQGILSTAIIVLGAAQSLMIATAALNSQINLKGSMAQLSALVGQLGSQILLFSNLADTSTASGVLTGSQQSLLGAAVSQSTSIGFLNAQIALLLAAVSVVTVAGNLATQIREQASALTVSSASGTLQSNILLAGTANLISAASGALMTAVRLAGPAINLIVAAGNLTAIITLLGQAADTSAVTGSITANTIVAATAVSLATARGQLSSLIQMKTNLFSDSQVMANLLSGIQAQAAFESDSALTGALTATGSPVGMYATDPFFVVGVRRQYTTTEFPAISVHEKVTLTFNFGDELWVPLTLEGIIDMEVVASAGVDNAVNTRLLGPAAYDKTLTKVLQPFGNGILDDDYYFTVTAPTSNGSTLTRFGLLSVRG